MYGLSNMARLVNFLVLAKLQTGVLEVETHGMVTQLYGYTSFFVVLLTYGMETAFFRFSQDQASPRVFSTAFKTLCYSSAGFLFLVFMLGSPLASWTGFEGEGNLIRCLAAILAMDAISAIPFAKLRQSQKPKRFALLKSLNLLINIAGNVIFLWVIPMFPQWWQNYGQTEMVNGIFFSNLIASLLTFIFLYPDWKDGLNENIDAALRSRMLKYALPLVWVGLAGMINETLDRVLMVYLRPEDGLYLNGIYGACYKISIFMTLFVQAYRFAAEPFFFSRMKAEDGSNQYVLTMDWFVAACSWIFLMITLFLPVFKHLISDRYWEGLHVVPILLLANLFLGIHYNLSIWYKLSDKTKLGSRISMVGALITVIGNVVFIPMFGFEGAAWTTLICYLSMAIMSYFMGQKHYPVPYHIRLNIGMIALSVLIYGLTTNLHVFNHISAYAAMSLSALLCISFGFLLYWLLKNPHRV